MTDTRTKHCVTCKTPTLVTTIHTNGNCPTCEKIRTRHSGTKYKELKVDIPDLPQSPELKALDSMTLAAEREDQFSRQEEAKKEQARRELARRHLLPFVQRNVEGYAAGWLHADICQRLERFSDQVARKESPRLMLSVPPRHGKSEIASKNFPAWHLGKFPKHEIIQASYASDLALDFSRKVRDLMKTNQYQALFPTRIDPKSSALERWNTTAGGAYTAVGVRGPITGRGAHIGIIDDPVKDRQDAESETLRQQVKDWYSSTFYTRLAPGGGIVVIMTRWHEDDLSGWLISVMEEAEKEMAELGHWPADADRWEVINYPAIAEQDETYRKTGEALHTDRYPLPALNKIKRALLPRDWSALYQQRPTLEDGDFFIRSNFRFYAPYDRPPLEELAIYTAWDLALGKKDTNDYTVCVIVGIARNGDIYVLHILRGRWGSLEIIEKMIEVQLQWTPILQGIESSMIEMSMEPMLIKITQERGVYLPYEKLKHKGLDKVARAQAIRTRVAQGRVLLPDERSAPWVAYFLDELVKFPGGKHDDQVDAFAWIGQMILMYAVVREKVVDTEPKWRKKLKALGRSKSGSAMTA